MNRKDSLEFCSMIGQGFKVEREPFKDWCDQTGLDLEDLFARVEDLKSRGWIRRVAVSVRHRGVGFKQNAMVIIRTEEDKVDKTGQDLARMDAVSHCYQRQHPDGDPYCLYVMIHAYTEDEIELVIDEVVKRSGAKAYEVLRSVQEFKKTSFVPGVKI